MSMTRFYKQFSKGKIILTIIFTTFSFIGLTFSSEFQFVHKSLPLSIILLHTSIPVFFTGLIVWLLKVPAFLYSTFTVLSWILTVAYNYLLSDLLISIVNKQKILKLRFLFILLGILFEVWLFMID